MMQTTSSVLLNHPQKMCPYLDQTNKQDCAMTKGGLYIPLPEHIDLFCMTANFSRCHQYLRGCELLNETAQQLGFTKEKNGRRQYRRMPEKLLVSVSLCDETGRPVAPVDETIKTMDISLGGLRLESRTRLPFNELIAFTFGPDFIKPGYTGLGRIKWCQADAAGDGFQSGLSFINADPRQVIGSHLGLPV